jgi:hypothetical protein
MMTASRRASATIAFFIPRFLAIFNADLVSTISLRRNTPNLLLSTSGPAELSSEVRKR